MERLHVVVQTEGDCSSVDKVNVGLKARQRSLCGGCKANLECNASRIFQGLEFFSPLDGSPGRVLDSFLTFPQWEISGYVSILDLLLGAIENCSLDECFDDLYLVLVIG